MITDEAKAERMLLGDRLARECERIAELCRRVGTGDCAAAAALLNNVDNYWHAIVIGTGAVEALCDAEHWRESDAEGE